MDAINKVNLRLKKILEYVDLLKKHQNITVKDLEDDPVQRGFLERYLQLACEAVIDIANLINAEYRFRSAEDARESILILGEEGVLEKKFAQEFAPVAGFRNILVHDYVKIDYKQVIDKLHHRLGDFERFSQQVAKYLK